MCGSSINPVVIVGGGLSGLAAAVQLGRLAIPTVLFDDGLQAGGRARTECRNGFHMNYGPHRLFEGGAAVTLLRRLGVEIDSVPRGGYGGFAVSGGRKHTFPVGYCSLLTTALLGVPAKRELARVLTSIRADDLRAVNALTIGQWLRTRVRNSDVIQLVQALVRYVTYCDEPDRQSAGAALEQLRLGINGDVLYVHKGWGTLVARLQAEAAGAGVQIVGGRRVVGVNVEGRRVTSVTFEDRTSAEACAVIIAASPDTSRRLLTGAPSANATTTPVRVASLDVALRRLPNRRAVFALSIDEPWWFSADSVVARVAPRTGGVVHLAKYLRGSRSDAVADERQLERALDLLQPGWRDLVVHRRFMPSVTVSHDLVAAESGGLAGRPSGRVPDVSNAFLAGDWIGPTGHLADASVASGVEAARRVARTVGFERERYGTQ